jgi:hypothetical protein
MLLGVVFIECAVDKLANIQIQKTGAEAGTYAEILARF